MKTDLPLHPLPLRHAREPALPIAPSPVVPLSDAAVAARVVAHEVVVLDDRRRDSAAPLAPYGDLAATVARLKLELARLRR
jgi:hypothetical protein